MIDRELTEREKEILAMIRPTTFRDIVETVRRDVEHSKYDAKRELRNLRNGTDSVTSPITNVRDSVNNMGTPCEVLT